MLGMGAQTMMHMQRGEFSRPGQVAQRMQQDDRIHPAGKGDAEMRYGNSRFKARGKKAFEGRRQRLSGPLVP